MLKQDVKTINAQLIRTRALSQLSLDNFRPYAISFLGFFLTLAFGPSKCRESCSDVSYLENWCRHFIQKKYGAKTDLSRTHFLFSEL